MQVKDLPGIDLITEDDCELCEVHKIADKVLNEVENPRCPLCHSIDLTPLGFYPVGEVNGIDPESRITKEFVSSCNVCSGYSIAAQRPITYNANHDVYYTGGDNYSPDWYESRSELQEMMLPKIENYLERVAAGEKALQPWNLAMWLSGGVAHLLARRYRLLWEKLHT